MLDEPLKIDHTLVYAFTSGASPLADHAGDEWIEPHNVFVEIWGWTLYNNGLAITEPVYLN